MSMLSISPDKYNQPLDFSEALGFGAEMVIIGMVAVFAVLGILWAVLTVFKFVFATSSQTSKAPALKESTPAPVVYTASNDAEIVAVIAAAIAMAESESDNGMKFRVVSFRRK